MSVCAVCLLKDLNSCGHMQDTLFARKNSFQLKKKLFTSASCILPLQNMLHAVDYVCIFVGLNSRLRIQLHKNKTKKNKDRK